MSQVATTTTPSNPATDPVTGRILIFTGSEGAIRLSIGVDTGSDSLIVRDARHEGVTDASTRRALDKLCTIVVGRPLQEAGDHGAIYAADALPADRAPVRGIRTPRNAGSDFVLAERLLRQVHASARQHFNIGHRENGWYLRPSANWLAQDETAQASSIKPIIASFLRTNGLRDGDIFISRIEGGTRVIVGFSEHVIYRMKPKLMMTLEQQLRRETGNPLELFMDEMKDANKIRRL
jgi:hypothetical protein